MMSRTLLFGFFCVISSVVMAGKDAPLLELSESAQLRFNGPFLVTSNLSRSGTGLQSVIELAWIDLKGTSHKAQLSRQKFGAAISKLRELKNFDKLESVYCFLDFNAAYDQDTIIEKGSTFNFRRPDRFGTPTQYTKEGKRITLDTEHDSAFWASFDAPDMGAASGSYYQPLLRRLYCSFSAVPQFGWGTDFVSDMKISTLEVLLSPYFDLKY